MTVWLRFCSLLSAVVVLLAGCGGSEPYRVIPISGTVSYEDGSLIPAYRIIVMFVPQVEALDSKTYPKPGEALVDPADGTFSEMTTYDYADGAVSGEHKVTVKATDEDENLTAAVPVEYTDVTTTPLKVTVSRESTTFDLEIAKPQ